MTEDGPKLKKAFFSPRSFWRSIVLLLTKAGSGVESSEQWTFGFVAFTSKLKNFPLLASAGAAGYAAGYAAGSGLG